MRLRELYTGMVERQKEIFPEEEALARSLLFLKNGIGIERSELLAEPDMEISDDKLSIILSMLERSCSGEPSAYIVGFKEFMSLKFDVNSSCLIPRPETELLVETVLERLHNIPQNPLNILDLGTGSGAIAISIAYYLKHASITAVDISEGALSIAASNGLKHGVSERISFVKSDLFDALPEKKVFDVIVSNPPYIAEDDEVERCVKCFEPFQALFSENDGLAVTEKILSGGRSFLKANGFIAIEINAFKGNKVCHLFDDYGYKDIVLLKDAAGHDRLVTASL